PDERGRLQSRQSHEDARRRRALSEGLARRDENRVLRRRGQERREGPEPLRDGPVRRQADEDRGQLARALLERRRDEGRLPPRRVRQVQLLRLPTKGIFTYDLASGQIR